MLRYYIVALLAFLVDQVTKWIVTTNMTIDQKIPFIPGLIGLTSIRNRGAAFGILQNQRLFFVVLTSIVLIGIVIYLRKVYREKKLLSYGLALIFGGALGNFVDRAFKGEVVDMLEFQFIDFPIFNMSDVFIFTGVFIVIIDSFLASKTDKDKIQTLPE